MSTLKGNAVVAQSGGPTAVINPNACGVIQEALRQRDAIRDAMREYAGPLIVGQVKIRKLPVFMTSQ